MSQLKHDYSYGSVDVCIAEDIDSVLFYRDGHEACRCDYSSNLFTVSDLLSAFEEAAKGDDPTGEGLEGYKRWLEWNADVNWEEWEDQ